MAFAQAPLPPVLNSPLHNATGVSTAPTLDVTVTDPDGDSLTVTYYGRVAPGPDFTIVPIPDTQFYTGEVRGGSNAMFKAQTDWIVANRSSRNIVFVPHLGDCVENGDNGGNPIEWLRADSAMVTIENPLATGLPEGLPYGVSVGNHDKSPVGSNGTTVLYNQFFGIPRFQGRSYYGGHYGSDNDNFFDLFSASGLDFIAISLEYDTGPDEDVLAWADSLLEAHANRRGIVYAHSITNTGNPATFTSMGQDIYDALKDRPNLFLMLGGHVPGEGRRVDTFNGNTVYSLLSDYQGRSNGGSGWLRIMEFSPANDVIRVRTYTPWLNQFEADADSSSQFTLGHVMGAPFTVIGTQRVASGSSAALSWPGRALGTAYQWYVTLSDGTNATMGPTWKFTTSSTPPQTITATAGSNGSISPAGPVDVAQGGSQTFTITPGAGYHVADVAVDGVSVGAVTSYTFTNVTASHTIAATFAINTYVLQTLVSGDGTITATPAQGSYPHGTSVQLLATPGVGSSFIGWTGDATGTANPLSLVMDGDKRVTAAFAPNAYVLVVQSEPVSGGTIQKSPEQASYGHASVVSLSAAPSLGWTCSSWSGDLSGALNPSSTTMTSNQGIVGVFNEVGAPEVLVVSPNGTETLLIGNPVDLTWSASDDAGIESVDVLLSRAGPMGPIEALALGIPNSGSWSWVAGGPPTTDAFLKIVARNPAGPGAQEGRDLSDGSFTITDGVVVVEPRALEFSLGPVAPNPSIGQARFGITLPATSDVRLEILDVHGRLVARVAEGPLDGGVHRFVWSGRTTAGLHAANGVYFAKLEAGGRVLSRRFAFLR